MGFVTPDPGGGDEAEPDGGDSLDLDLDLRACPVCRRELLPWQETCPDHDAEAVPRTELPPSDGPPVPDHLREALDDGDGAGSADGPDGPGPGAGPGRDRGDAAPGGDG